MSACLSNCNKPMSQLTVASAFTPLSDKQFDSQSDFRLFITFADYATTTTTTMTATTTTRCRVPWRYWQFIKGHLFHWIRMGSTSHIAHRVTYRQHFQTTSETTLRIPLGFSAALKSSLLYLNLCTLKLNSLWNTRGFTGLAFTDRR